MTTPPDAPKVRNRRKRKDTGMAILLGSASEGLMLTERVFDELTEQAQTVGKDAPCRGEEAATVREELAKAGTAEVDPKLRRFALLVRQGCLLIAKGVEREFMDERKDKAA